jgi:hypothetical protein
MTKINVEERQAGFWMVSATGFPPISVECLRGKIPRLAINGMVVDLEKAPKGHTPKRHIIEYAMDYTGGNVQLEGVTFFIDLDKEAIFLSAYATALDYSAWGTTKPQLVIQKLAGKIKEEGKMEGIVAEKCHCGKDLPVEAYHGDYHYCSCGLRHQANRLEVIYASFGRDTESYGRVIWYV